MGDDLIVSHGCAKQIVNSNSSDFSAEKLESRINEFMVSRGFDLMKLFPSVPEGRISADLVFPTPPSDREVDMSLFPSAPDDQIKSADLVFPTPPNDREVDIMSLFPSAPDDQMESADFVFPTPPSDQEVEIMSSEKPGLEEIAFYEAVKDFNEEQLFQYVRDGHLPPPGQAFKIRHKESDHWNRSKKLERSFTILSNGTIFTTGKNENIFHGEFSIPGGKESKFLGEGHSKRAFSVFDYNKMKPVVILIPNPKEDMSAEETAAELKSEAAISKQIASDFVVPVSFYSRNNYPKDSKCYLESELCEGGSLKDHPELHNNPFIHAQVLEADADIRRAGFEHNDLLTNNGNVVFAKKPNPKDLSSLKIRVIDFGFTQRR